MTTSILNQENWNSIPAYPIKNQPVFPSLFEQCLQYPISSLHRELCNWMLYRENNLVGGIVADRENTLPVDGVALFLAYMQWQVEKPCGSSIILLPKSEIPIWTSAFDCYGVKYCTYLGSKRKAPIEEISDDTILIANAREWANDYDKQLPFASVIRSTQWRRMFFTAAALYSHNRGSRLYASIQNMTRVLSWLVCPSPFICVGSYEFQSIVHLCTPKYTKTCLKLGTMWIRENVIRRGLELPTLCKTDVESVVPISMATAENVEYQEREFLLMQMYLNMFEVPKSDDLASSQSFHQMITQVDLLRSVCSHIWSTQPIEQTELLLKHSMVRSIPASRKAQFYVGSKMSWVLEKMKYLWEVDPLSRFIVVSHFPSTLDLMDSWMHLEGYVSMEERNSLRLPKDCDLNRFYMIRDLFHPESNVRVLLCESGVAYDLQQMISYCSAVFVLDNATLAPSDVYDQRCLVETCKRAGTICYRLISSGTIEEEIQKMEPKMNTERLAGQDCMDVTDLYALCEIIRNKRYSICNNFIGSQLEPLPSSFHL